ncbi:MAG: VWA domain-containing protein [Nannocystaceae bacterium]
MRSWLTTILVTLPLLVPGCRTSGTVTPIVGEGPGTGPGTGVGKPIGDPLTAYYAGPAHTFTARPHPAHTRPLPPPPPDGRSLPKMVDRISQCYSLPRPEPKPITTTPRPVTKKKVATKPSKSSGYVAYGSGNVGSAGASGGGTGSGYGRGSGAGGGGSASDGSYVPYTRTPTPTPTRTDSSLSTKYKSTDAAPSGGVAGGMVSGDTAVSSRPTRVAQAEPPPAAAEATATRESNVSKKEARKDRRERREAERQAAKRPASPAAESAAYEPMGGADIATEEDYDGEPMIAERPLPGDEYSDWGQATYLSNDDTMSLSSAQRIIYAIDRYLPLPADHIRPHELLNYFSFNTVPVAETDDFSVLAEIAPNAEKQGIYDLSLAVRGKAMDVRTRRNAALTYVIDRSGSMSDEGRMNYLKQGMHRMASELKTGDIINMVVFDHEVCTPLENFVVGRDNPAVLTKAIDAMKPRGSTDLYSGLSQGYTLADRSYQPTYNNRVMLITDALANTGVTDTRAISMVGKYYDERRIRLSGVGVGTEFNDELLDRLTEKGKGAYVFLGSEAEVDAVFGPRFISLLETTALDVHFQLHLPPSMRMNVFYGEEASAVKEEVQAIHYFANTSQLFFSEVMARGGKMRPQDSIMLTIEYEDPETGVETMEEVAWNLGEIQKDSANIHKARLLMDFVEGLQSLASRPPPPGYRTYAGGWNDYGGWQICDEVSNHLERQAQSLASDSEATRVRGLWAKFCARYDRPSQPASQPVEAQPQGWPSAKG